MDTSEQTAPPAAAPPVSLLSEAPLLEAVQLRKVFPLQVLNPFQPRRAVQAVEEASIALYPRRAIALVGESGSGKTTVARMLARLYEPTGGTILFRGTAVKLSERGAALRDYRRQVQMVFQDPFSSLNPVHNVRYHLRRPLQVYGHARTLGQVDEQVLALLNRVNLTPAEQLIQK